MNKNHKKLLIVCAFVVTISVSFLVIFSLKQKKMIPPKGLFTTVVFDESHRQSYSIWDTKFMGYSKLGERIIDHGYKISSNSRSISELIPALSFKDILVLGIANYESYTLQEADSLISFIKNGGGVLIIGEHDNVFKIGEFQNRISQLFNVSFNNDHIFDKNRIGGLKITNQLSPSTLVTWIKVKSDYFNLENIYFYTSCSINVPKDGTILAKASTASEPESAIVAASCTYGKGKIVWLGDSEFLWNGNKLFGVEHGENIKFILRIIDFLADKPQDEARVTRLLVPGYSLFTAKKFMLDIFLKENNLGKIEISTEISGGEVTPKSIENPLTKTSWDIRIKKDGYIKFKINNKPAAVVYFLSPKRSKLNVLITERYHSRKIDETPSGLLEFSKKLRDRNINVFATSSHVDTNIYNGIIIANPLSEIPREEVDSLETKKNFKKILLVGESSTSLEACDRLPQIISAYLGVKPLENNINQLANPFGINFTHYLLTSEVDNNVTINSRVIFKDSNRTFTSYRGAVVLPLEKDVNIIAEGDPHYSWGDDAGVGMYSKVMRHSYDSKHTSMIIGNDHILAIGDADVISNQHIKEDKEAVVAFIADWLRK
ncbi:MAG: hypothetical protein V1872_06205 [bacterium]